MNIDTELAIRCHVQMEIAESVPHAEKLVAGMVIPSMSDSKRVGALDVAILELKSALYIGHTDVDQEWVLIAAIAQSALEGIEAGRAAAPLNGDGR